MTIPLSGVRGTSATGGGSAMDVPFVQAKVLSIDIEKNIALCRDSLSRMLSIRLDIQRSKGMKPECGETWIVDKYYGVWTFAALMQGDTKGVVTPIENIPDLAPTLEAHQDNIDANAEIVAGMQVTITITNVQGTNKRYVDGTLSDGTSVTTVPCVGEYYPQVGDVAWVLRQGVANDANSTPSLIVMGRSGVVPGAPFGQGIVTRSQVVAESVLYLMADKRLTAPASGVYQLSRGFVDANGTPTYTSWIDTIQYGADQAPLERNNIRNIGMLWGSGRFYFTAADGNGRAPIEAYSLTTSAGGGMTIGQDANGNASVIFPFRDISLVAGVDGLHVADAANTKFNPILTGSLTVSGQTKLNGGLIGTFGASLKGAAIQGDQIVLGSAVTPTFGQVYAIDVTGTNNIAVGNTFFYKGVAQNLNPASERSFKEHIENLDDPWDFLHKIVAARFRWLDPEHFDDRTHVGIYVDEMAEADPDTVYLPELTIEPGVEEDEDIPTDRWRANHGRIPEERALLAYLARAAQDLDLRMKAVERFMRSPKS